METHKVTIEIGGRKYSSRMPAEEEQQVRIAADRIYARVFEYRLTYADKDMQDILAMVLLDTTRELMSLEGKDEIADTLRQVDELTAELDKYLTSQSR